VGNVGVLLKFGTNGSRDDKERHQCVAVEATWTPELGDSCARSEVFFFFFFFFFFDKQALFLRQQKQRNSA